MDTSSIFEYQHQKNLFTLVFRLMVGLCERELIEIGAINTKKTYRGFFIQAFYKINYTSSLLSRVLTPFSFTLCYDTTAIKKIHKGE